MEHSNNADVPCIVSKFQNRILDLNEKTDTEIALFENEDSKIFRID